MSVDRNSSLLSANADFMVASTKETEISRFRQWWLIIVLTLVSMLAMIDKNFIQLMVGSIKHDLALTDVEISLLIGAAFAIANLLTSLPAGWLADRISRRRIILGGVALWSTSTVAFGAGNSFYALFAARAAVGCGEGLVPPACYSLIGDGVAVERRGRALAIYTMATTAGAAVSLIVAGGLVSAIVAYRLDWLPFIGTVHPWQMALVLMGFVGLPVMLLVVTLPEVPRRSSQAVGQITSFRDVCRLMLQRPRLFLPLLIYSMMQSMIMAAYSAWLPAMIERKFDLSPAQFGPVLGMLLILFGPLGAWLSGFGIDLLGRKGLPGAGIVATVGAVFLLVTTAILPHMPTFPSMMLLEAVAMMSLTPFLVVVASLVSSEVPAQMAGKTIALFILMQGLAGPALAPTITALFSDFTLAGRSNALGESLSLVSAGCGIIGLAGAVRLYLIQMREWKSGGDA